MSLCVFSYEEQGRDRSDSQNFYGDAVVTIGGSMCGPVVVDPSFGSIYCTAPSGYGDGMLTVNVSGLVTSTPFAYDPPSITSVWPSPIDAMSSSTVVKVGVQSLHLALIKQSYLCFFSSLLP